jgi:hypothetical protein
MAFWGFLGCNPVVENEFSLVIDGVAYWNASIAQRIANLRFYAAVNLMYVTFYYCLIYSNYFNTNFLKYFLKGENIPTSNGYRIEVKAPGKVTRMM